MKNKVVVVTGATSGIGKESCYLLAGRGMAVVAAGRNKAVGKALQEEIVASGGKILFVETDVGNETAVQALIEKTCEHFGGVDYAFNCAATEGKLVPFIEQKASDWQAVIDTNLKGVWLCMKYEISAMLKRGGGAIVNVSSHLANFALPGSSVYTASKAGVNALTRVAAIEYGKRKIRVNAISPGAVDTAMLERITTEEVRNAIKEQNPLEKNATARDIAEAALWLLSPLAGHVNGENITIDGGHNLII